MHSHDKANESNPEIRDPRNEPETHPQDQTAILEYARQRNRLVTILARMVIRSIRRNGLRK